MASHVLSAEEIYNSGSSHRRTTELLLLCAGAIPVLLFYLLYVVDAEVADAGLSSFEGLSIETFTVPIMLCVAFAIAHVAICFLAPGADQVILPIVFVLSGIGITFVSRLAPTLAINQVIWLLVAVAAMVVTLLLVQNLDRLAHYQYTIGAIGIILILLPMLIGTEQGGSKLWLSIGGLSFQPGELAKIAIVLFLASYLAANRELLSISAHQIGPFKFPRLRMLLPVFIMWGLSLLIVIFERDLGSALLFFVVFVVMLYVTTGRWGYVIVSIILLGIGGIVCYHFFGHVRVRFDTWIDPFADAQGGGMQIVQSLYSLADGGLFGQGIGRGLPKLIPVVESDFIFSAIGEEMGLLGASAVLLLYMLFAIRGFATAARAKSDMAAFTAVGLTTSICFQAFLIVAGVTRLMPLTGVTLPFMSQGGSSLLASFIIVGLLLRCGDQATGHTSQMVGSGIDASSAELQESKKNTEDPSSLDAATIYGAEQQAAQHTFFSRLHKTKPQRTHAPRHSAQSKLSYGLKTPESGVLGRVALSKRLVVLVTFFTVLFFALIANLTYIQIVKADEYQSMPNNNHVIYRSSTVPRGSIVTSDGVTLAESLKNADGTYSRSYPQGNLAAHTVGYLSTQYGASGIEASQNNALTGRSDHSTWMAALNSLAGVPQPGNSVVLTLNSKIQKACENALKGYTGAIVVLNPATGAVLASASSPTYSESELQSIMSGQSQKQGVLINRATSSLYAPGSTFKVVTLAAGLDTGLVDLDTTFSGPATMKIGNADVINNNNQSYGTITLSQALANSVNTVFGQLAVKEGANTLVGYADAFGYAKKLGQDFSTVASLMPNPQEMTEWETAWAGCGEPVGEHDSPAGPQTTVMQNAVIAAAVANKGLVMNPYLVQRIVAADGHEVSKTQPKSLGQAISAATAEKLGKAMLEVTTSGTGTASSVSGVKVAGKTGTAEVGKRKNGETITNSLFIGFAPYDNPSIAISVCLEGSETQDVHGKAATVAGQVLTQALSQVSTK